ncbi:MAG: hypoxanthine phosphoribosyltransferase [Oscillospiraceae bacterium]|nr:hypoxanthine phosphoribosyltransferase [Oscillospiraceae bacterium]
MSSDMHKDVGKILFTERKIRRRIQEMGTQMAADYKGKNPMMVAVLKGSFVFMADLVRAMDIPCEIEFLGVSSYEGKATTNTGAVRLTKDLNTDIADRHVIVVEDILDSGLTLQYLMGYLKNRQPASMEICTLLDKPERRKAEVYAKYKGFTVPDAFVVGYGLDYDEGYRNLPYIGVLKPEIYE